LAMEEGAPSRTMICAIMAEVLVTFLRIANPV